MCVAMVRGLYGEGGSEDGRGRFFGIGLRAPRSQDHAPPWHLIMIGVPRIFAPAGKRSGGHALRPVREGWRFWTA